MVEGIVNGASIVSFILEVLSSMMLESDIVEAVILPPWKVRETCPVST